MASRARSVDRELDLLERKRVDSIDPGTKAPGGAASVVRLGPDDGDLRRARLLGERAELVAQLNELRGDV